MSFLKYFTSKRATASCELDDSTDDELEQKSDAICDKQTLDDKDLDDSLDDRSLTSSESALNDDDDGVDVNHDDVDDDDIDDTTDDDDGDDANNASKNKKQTNKTKKKTKKSKDKNDNPLLPEEMCELPTFLNSANCDKKLIEETREYLCQRYSKRPQNFVQTDYERMLVDDWTVSRFLLRCRQSPKRAAKLMELCGKFRREFRMGSSQPSDFPIEFHKSGGLFRYAPDRVGNQTLYMRVKMHLRSNELSKIMKEFILCSLEECDKANNGRGTAIIFDLTGCGMQNVDPSFLFWLIYSFRTYCPKGLSYIIVYNLPWILSATAKLALSWLSSTNRKRLRFVSGEAIQDYIAPENLPDFMGGTCKQNYRLVPRESRRAVETAEQYNMTREQSRKILDDYIKFLKKVDPSISLETASEEDFKETTQ